MAAWNGFCLCITACPPDRCCLSAVLPEFQGFGDLLNESLEQIFNFFCNFSGWICILSHLPIVSIIHPMAWVSRWSCCPDLSRLIVQNSNTPGLSCPRVGASWGSSPTQWQRFKLLVSPLISTVTSLIHRKYLLDVHLCNLAHNILLLTRVLGLQIDNRSDEKFRQGFIALPAIAEGSKNK